MKLREVIQSLDWVLLSAMLLLILLGFSMLLGTANVGSLITPLFLRQAIAAGIGLGFLILLAKFPYHTWQRYAPFLYIAGILSLIVVTVIGSVIRGTVSRFEIFGFQLQPSEFMKVGLVIALAWLLSRFRYLRWRELLLTGLLVGVPTILVLREPDFGVAALMLGICGGVLLFSGLRWQYVVVLGLLGVLVAGGAWQWVLLDYQKQRLETFLNPGADPLGSGYNVTQSMIALGSGKLWGRGLGHGPQSQLNFLPERHTDFILASIGEELGFIGVTLVIGLYIIMLWRLLRIIQSTQDKFGQLIVVGTFFMLLGSFIVSAGMNMGITPVTGIPLPLVSYGGSNLLATCLLLGIVQSVRVYSRFVRGPAPEISGFV